VVRSHLARVCDFQALACQFPTAVPFFFRLIFLRHRGSHATFYLLDASPSHSLGAPSSRNGATPVRVLHPPESLVSQRSLFPSLFHFCGSTVYGRATHRPGPGIRDSGRLLVNRGRERITLVFVPFEARRQLCRCSTPAKLSSTAPLFAAAPSLMPSEGPAPWNSACLPARTSHFLFTQLKFWRSISTDITCFRSTPPVHPGKLPRQQLRRCRQS